MRVLLVALMVSAPGTAGAVSLPNKSLNPLAAPSANCPGTTHYHAWDRGKAVKPQKLTELPDANAYAAVYRRIRGCEAPVVVRYGVSRR